MKRPNGSIIDLFCGAGGMTQGIHLAGCKVDVAVNHWRQAIEVHGANNPDTDHEFASVWEIPGPERAARIGGRRGCFLLAGAPDCTEHSGAKDGNLPKSAKRRSLPNAMLFWAARLKPRWILVENVEALRKWGPLDGNGIAVKERQGEDFERWIGQIRAMGYSVEHRLLWAHHYGAATKRKRLFVIARRGGGPIPWPEQTHGGPGQPPFEIVADYLDWSIPMCSIFATPDEARAFGKRHGVHAPKRPLADKTMVRIAEGVRRFVLNGKPYLVNLSHGGRIEPIDEPARTFTATPAGGDRLLVAPMLVQAHGHGYGTIGGRVDAPGPTLTTTPEQALVAATFLDELHGSALAGQGVDEPCSTITAGGGHHGLVAANLGDGVDRSDMVAGFLVKHFKGATGQGLGEPIGTITTVDHHSVAAIHLSEFYGSGGQWQGVDSPLNTIPTLARFASVAVEIGGRPRRIRDIFMRMLHSSELLRLSSFSADYDLGNNSERDKIAMIGNAVPPKLVAAIVRGIVQEDGRAPLMQAAK